MVEIYCELRTLLLNAVVSGPSFPVHSKQTEPISGIFCQIMRMAVTPCHNIGRSDGF